ncbi:MAG TPA: GMC family oxidoreductase [Verrucomicrobiae bacterium]|nr:GMC family oxidoreductase [Verrucomicrobiae bacterium]
MKERLNAWLHDTASALAYSLAEPHANPAHAELQPPYNDLTRFILEQHGRMPDYLRTPFAALTLGFDLAGHRFHTHPPAARAKQIAAWRNSGSAFRRDLVRYFESLGILELYSRGMTDTGATNPATPTESFQSRVFTEPQRELSYEIVVVGSGPGGAITAALLAEAGRNVLLIEEGDYLSLASCAPFSRDEMVQKYRNGGQTVALGANKISYVEGRCVGGGSEINSGLYHRTPPEVLETWRKEFQVDGAGEEEMRAHFEACERDVSVSNLPGPAPAASLRLHDGATRMGWKSLEVPRWFRYSEGTTDAASGKRQSMTETFIPRFFKAGGRLLPRTRVVRISQEGGKWKLEASHATKGAIRISAETLFICGGAVQTPALLRRSGITQNIGNSLRLHPTIKVVAKFAETVNSAQMGVPVHQVKEFAPRFSFGCSISTPPYLALALLEHPEEARKVSDTWTNLATYYAMITGEGRGTVRSLPHYRDPLVRHGLTPNDRRDLAEGLKKLCEALVAGGATELYPGITRGPQLLKRDDLSKLPEVLPSGLASLMTIHLFSSCSMGEDKSKCAADSYGRVHGFKNLHIADASLLCTAPGVNPQGSVMAFARRNVMKFLEGR